jgi:hypothetical protein
MRDILIGNDADLSGSYIYVLDQGADLLLNEFDFNSAH